MATTLPLCAWWLAENSLVHCFTFDFLLSAARMDGRRYLPLWLAASGGATLAAVLFRPPAAFLFSVLFLALFARMVLGVSGSDLIVPVAIITTLCTLKEGVSALILSWLSVSFRSPTGGAAEQIVVPLLLDALLFASLRAARDMYSRVRRPLDAPHLHILLLPCVFAVLAVRCGLRLDCPGFAPYLSALGLGARLSALCAMTGAAVVVFTAFCSFCRLICLSGREELLRRQLAEARERNERRAAFQHDIDNHLTVISGLLREKSFHQAERYASRLRASSVRLRADVSTGSLALDVLLREKLSAAQDNQIAAACAVDIPEDFGVEDTDLCTLFSNILDNAVAACLKEPPEARSFSVSARAQSQLLVVEAVNTAAGGGPVVFGTGLSNIRRIAEKYHGAMETELAEGRFRISVLLCAR